MTSNNIQYTDLSEYFKDNEYAVCSLNIFVKTCDDINKAEEVYKIIISAYIIVMCAINYK